MKKIILAMLFVGVFFAGTIFAPQFVAADHDADFGILQGAFGILLNAVINGFNAVATGFIDLQAEVDANMQKSSDNMMDISEIQSSVHVAPNGDVCIGSSPPCP